MITPEIFVSDILSAHDFYCKKLPFRCLTSDERTAQDDNFLIEGSDALNKVQIRIKIPDNLDLLKLLNEEKSPRILFGNVDIGKLLEHLESNIPEFTVDKDAWSELPKGHFDGPYEFPGGLLIYLRDPFGNYFWFSEW